MCKGKHSESLEIDKTNNEIIFKTKIFSYTYNRWLQINLQGCPLPSPDLRFICNGYNIIIVCIIQELNILVL